MATVRQVALQFRKAILDRDDAALLRLRQAYGATLRDLLPLIDKLLAQIAATSDPSWGLLWGAGRAADLVAQIDAVLRHYGGSAAQLVAAEQQVALNAGLEHAAGTLRGVMPTPAWGDVLLAQSYNRIPTDALQALVGILSDGSPLGYKFANLSQETVSAIKGAIQSGFTRGLNPRQIAAAIKRISGGMLSNALTMSRTETLRAYRISTQETYRANNHLLDGWIWVAGHSPRTCAACWAMDGTKHPMEEDFNDHPNGRCTMVPVLKPWSEIIGHDVPGATQPAQEQDPTAAFLRMSETQQRQVLGPTRLEAFQRGDLDLRDIADYRQDPTWGPSPRIRTIGELGIGQQITA